MKQRFVVSSTRTLVRLIGSASMALLAAGLSAAGAAAQTIGPGLPQVGYPTLYNLIRYHWRARTRRNDGSCHHHSVVRACAAPDVLGARFRLSLDECIDHSAFRQQGVRLILRAAGDGSTSFAIDDVSVMTAYPSNAIARLP